MRKAAVVLALLLVTGASARSGEEPTDSEVETFALILRTTDRPDVLNTTVVDARDGKPIAGSIVRGYAESIDGRAVAVNALLVTLETDAYGLAVGGIDTKALGASHWIISAPGYRPFAKFHGYWPPERVDLEPSTPVAVRVLDAYGDPAAGAEVEGYEGCPHAPPAVHGLTNDDGVFRAPDGSPDGFSLWVRAPGCAFTNRELPAAFGDEPRVAVLSPGIVAQGRLRDEDGRPIPGAVLRGTEYPRGPATLTDGEGRFRLAGLAAEEGVRVFHPTLRVEAGHVIERVAPDVPLDLTWTFEGIGRAKAYGTLVIRARDGKGGGVEDLHLLVLGADGQGQDVVTNGEGEAIVDLPSARCRIRGDSPFDAFDVVEASVVVPAEGEGILDLVLSPRPRLRIVGDIPADLVPVLVAAGREHGMAETAEDGDAPPPLWLSTEARAVVCLRNFEQGWAYFVPVGPTIDGVRTATLDVPAPHRVRLAEDDALDGAYAVLAPRANPRDERLVEIEDGVISLRCGGRFALTVDLEDGTPVRLVDVGLPPLAAGAVERRIDLERDGAPDTKSGEARLVITRADGKAMGELMVSSGRVGAGWRGARGRLSVRSTVCPSWRMTKPSALSRESMTLSSFSLQNGQRIQQCSPRLLPADARRSQQTASRPGPPEPCEGGQ